MAESLSELEGKALEALRNSHSPLKALGVAKAIGKTTAKDVNPTLYGLEKKGLVCRHLDGQTPMWRIAGSSPASATPPIPATWNDAPLYTRRDSGNGEVTFSPVRRDDVLNQSIAAMTLSQPLSIPSDSGDGAPVPQNTALVVDTGLATLASAPPEGHVPRDRPSTLVPVIGGQAEQTQCNVPGPNGASVTPNGATVSPDEVSADGINVTSNGIGAATVTPPPTTPLTPQAQTTGTPSPTRSDSQSRDTPPFSSGRKNKQPVKLAANFGASTPPTPLRDQVVRDQVVRDQVVRDQVVSYLETCSSAVDANTVAKGIGCKSRGDVYPVLTGLATDGIVREERKDGSVISLWRLIPKP